MEQQGLTSRFTGLVALAGELSVKFPQNGRKKEIMKYVIIGLFWVFIAIFIAGVVVMFKNKNRFDKKLDKQMLEDDEEYFEVRYFKNMYFLDSLVYVPLALIALIPTFDPEISFGYRMSYLGIAVGLLGYALYIYLSKMLCKLVFDHGQIALYTGNKMKLTCSLDQIDFVARPAGTVATTGHLGPEIPYRIYFDEGDKGKFISFDEDMDNSYKLVAIFKKGNYFKRKNKRDKKRP